MILGVDIKVTTYLPYTVSTQDHFCIQGYVAAPHRGRQLKGHPPPRDLIHCTNEPNVSIPQLANLLIERSQNTNWVVVFKSLITVHHMMCYGNEGLEPQIPIRIRVLPTSDELPRNSCAPPQGAARLGERLKYKIEHIGCNERWPD
uniref:AP180 N-terminal homology (ANTH) domain-containing protein n=1 Tax=Timema genevievae TaxID=629358 RepID=A0A7R9JNJ8_TIMGE|nr:unnamed protein product [Timema genevievae]